MRRVRLFAAAAASTTLVWNHRGRTPGKNLEILDSAENVGLQNSTAEPWDGKSPNLFGNHPRINRRTSFAGSVASTDSTMSIMAYVKSLQVRIRPSSERDLFYAYSPRNNASVEQPTSLNTIDPFDLGSFIQAQDQELDATIRLESKVGLEMNKAGDGDIISTEIEEIHSMPEVTERLGTLELSNGNLGTILYHQTTILFKSLAPLIARSPELKISSRVLLEDLGRLHLWEATFEDGELNTILAESEAIQTTVIDLTFALSRILVEYVLPALGQTYTDPKVDEQIKALTNLLQRTEQHLFGANHEQHDSPSGDDERTNDPEYSVEDAAFLIRSSVDCLMELLPSMERILASLE